MTKTYAQVTREIAALQSTATRLYALEVKEAVAKINGIISKYSLSAADLKFAGSSSTTKVADRAKAVAPAATRDAAKYGDGNGRTWSGRGPRPAWLRSALEAGQSLESFLTDAKSAVIAAASKVKPQVSPKTQTSKAAGVPKYQHPKSGVTWTGRGPRPQWLKAALRKRGSAIEDFLIGAPVRTDAAAAASTSVAVPAKKSAEKKATAKKIVAPNADASVAATSAAKPATQKTVSPAKKTSTNAPSPKAAVKTPVAKKAVAVASKKTVASASKKTVASAKQPAPPNAAKVSTKASGGKPAAPAAPTKPLIPRTKAKKTVTTTPVAPVPVASTLPDAVTPIA